VKLSLVIRARPTSCTMRSALRRRSRLL
jgi:hypothetical protein